jgi:pimeloyl-ACP methyl ester carboxylesterase
MKYTALILLTVLLNACANTPVPDLKRLYETQPLVRSTEVSPGKIQPPVILIHGAFGARLRDTVSHKEVWPGGLRSLLFHNYQEVALPINPDSLLPGPSPVEAYAITDKAAGQDFYGAIIRTLKDAGGYIPGVSGQPVTDGRRRYYIFFYDWRQDNVQTARKLDALIEQIREDHNAPDLRVDIVAHSMGGLVTRYYLRYGREDVLEGNDFQVNNYGASRVRKVVLLGTPNLGSVSGLQEFIQGFKVGLRRIPTEVVATLPSAYQLFPHPIRTSLVLLNGKELERDLFDTDVWRAFEWSIFDPVVRERILKRFKNPSAGTEHLALLERYFEKHIERARRFVWSLSVPMQDSPVRYIVFGGDCELTPARMLIEEVKGESVLRLYPHQVSQRLADVDYNKLMLEPGDGRVTRPSLFARESLDPSVPRHKFSFFPLDHSILLCESHDSMTGNISFQNNLLNILLTQERALTPMNMEN